MKNLLIPAFLILCSCERAVDAPTSEILDQSIIDRLPVMMEAYGVDGMVVSIVSGQDTLLSAGFGVTIDEDPFTVDTACPVYSATKVFTSLTIASMVEDDRFDVNTKLGTLLTDVPVEWSDIPFWRLLNHTSGITMIVNKPEFETLLENPQSGNLDVYNFVRKIPLDYQPGEYSRYRQSGYGIAEMILSNMNGADWPTLVAKHVTTPADASQTVYTDMHVGKRSASLLSSAGGFQTNSSDMVAIFKSLNRGEIVSRSFLEDWLYNDAYNFDGYSLGSVLVNVGDIRTIGHSGGGRANLRYAPKPGVGVMVCTDDRQNNNIMHDVANMIMRELLTDETTLMPIQTRLHALRGKPAEEIVRGYKTAKTSVPKAYDFTGVQNTLNQIGYAMLTDGKPGEAVEIFRLNVSEHPLSANAYDSLGEALLSNGDTEGALRNYQKVLEIDPDNGNAVLMIDKINNRQPK